jgi:hypothetical protein
VIIRCESASAIGWFYSAAIGAIMGYSARESGINATLVVGWLIVAIVISVARLIGFAFDEPGWWEAQVSMKGVGTVAMNTLSGMFAFAAVYAVIMGGTGLLAYGIARLLQP